MADGKISLTGEDLARFASGRAGDVRKNLEMMRAQEKFIVNWGAKHQETLKRAMDNQLKLAYQENNILIKKANLINLLSSTENRAGGMTNNLALALTRLGPPTGNLSRIIQTLHPDVNKAAEKTGELGIGMLKVAGIMLVLDTVFNALKGVASGSRDTFNRLAQAVGFNNVTVQESIGAYTAARASGILWGGTQKDVNEGLRILTSNFIVNKFSMDRLGTSTMMAGRELGKSVALLIGMGHGLGATSEQVFGVTSNLGLMGAQIKDLPDAFARFVDVSSKTGLGFDRLSEALGNIAPVSQLAANATEQLYGVFATFKDNFNSKFADPIIRFANSSGRFNLLAEAMTNFSRIAASMGLGELMAFGPMTGRLAGASPFEALRQSLRKGPQAAFANFASEIMERSRTPDQAKFALTALMTQRGLKPEAASFLAAQMADNMERIRRATNETDRKTATATRDALLKSATMQNILQDPLEKIVAMLETFFGFIHEVVYRWFHIGAFAGLAMPGKAPGTTGSPTRR